MPNFNTIADEVVRKLSGYTLHQDRQTYLSEAVTSTYSSTLPSSIKVNSADNISSGVIQIDDELIYVDSYDRDNKVLVVPPYGRGYNGTTAASHAAGSKVVISPTFPRVDVKNAINETIDDMFPGIFAVTSYTFKYNPSVLAYALPNDVENVIAVSAQSTGPTKEWYPVRAWRVDPMANTDAFDSKNTISIYSVVDAGRTINVTYSTQPSPMENGSDDFESTTGLPASCKDVAVLGAAYRLSAFIDPGRLTFGSAEADQQSQIAGRSYGAGTSASKYLLALYQQRLQQETNKIQGRYPARLHYTR